MTYSVYPGGDPPNTILGPAPGKKITDMEATLAVNNGAVKFTVSNCIPDMANIGIWLGGTSQVQGGGSVDDFGDFTIRAKMPTGFDPTKTPILLVSDIAPDGHQTMIGNPPSTWYTTTAPAVKPTFTPSIENFVAQAMNGGSLSLSSQDYYHNTGPGNPYTGVFSTLPGSTIQTAVLPFANLEDPLLTAVAKTLGATVVELPAPTDACPGCQGALPTAPYYKITDTDGVVKVALASAVVAAFSVRSGPTATAADIRALFAPAS